MYKYIFILLVSLSLAAVATHAASRQKFPGGKCVMYRVSLTDKSDTAFSVEHPEKFLSPRAIERRRRQGIGISVTDLPVTPAYLQGLQESGAEILAVSKWHNSVLVKLRRSGMAQKLTALPYVKDAVQVFAAPDSVERQRDRSPFSTPFNGLDNMRKSTYGLAYEQINAIGGTPLHDAGFMGQGMMIAVFDAGFASVDRVPQLKGISIAGTRDFAYPRQVSVFESGEHGTFVLSTMASHVCGTYVGTAPKASYLLCRTETMMTESASEEDFWTAAAEYADSMGVDVISSSLSYHDYDNGGRSYAYCDLDGRTAFVSQTASMLASKGIILVNSAGNDGMGQWKKIGVPSDATDILTVGAVDEKGVNSAFSSVGPSADNRVKPDIMALGTMTTVVSPKGTYEYKTGTSFSTPIVAGMVACLWQALPDRSAVEIMQMVRQSGNRASCPDNIYGYGIPDFGKAWKGGRR